MYRKELHYAENVEHERTLDLRVLKFAGVHREIGNRELGWALRAIVIVANRVQNGFSRCSHQLLEAGGAPSLIETHEGLVFILRFYIHVEG